MWLFTQHGFFSAVSARDGKAGFGHVDLSRIMVRARVRSHLERLMVTYPEPFEGLEIKESPGNDYRWRVFIAKDAWASVMASLALDTDYDNFKTRAHREWPIDPAGYVNMLHRVWSQHADIQTNAEGKKVGAYSSRELRKSDLLPYEPGKGKGKRKAGDRTQPKGLTAQEYFDNYQGTDEPILSDADLESLRDAPLVEPVSEPAPSKPLPSKPKRERKAKGADAEPVHAPVRGYSPGTSHVGHPAPDENVYVVQENDRNGAVVGVIWWSTEFTSPEQAYGEAVTSGIVPDFSPVVISRLAYRDTLEFQRPVYDWRSFDLATG